MKSLLLAVALSGLVSGFGIEQDPIPLDELSGLEEYVKRPDPNWSYSRVSACEEDTEHYTIYCVKMYSQKWLDSSVWHSPTHQDSLWWHYQVIIVPKQFSDDLGSKGYMQIEAGSNNGNPPNIQSNEDIDMAKLIAIGSGMVSSILFQVPNQPIYFFDDWWIENGQTHGRKEDQFCSYTWRLFLNDITGDEMPENAKGWGDQMIAYLPMTKSAVRGLDTIQDFCLKELNHEIDGFLVAGGSKRGWTTWFTGVVEPERVLAIAPVVLDLLNMHVSLKHHFMSLGNWSFALEDFDREDLLAQLDNPEWQSLQKIIDPFNYRLKLENTPKYSISCSGDPFFLVDDNRYYLSRMGGEMHGYLMGNCEHSTVGHSLTNRNIFRSVIAWFRAVVTKSERPKISWSEDIYSLPSGEEMKSTELYIESDIKPVDVTVKLSKTKKDYTGGDFHRRDWRWAVPKQANDSESKAKYDLRPVEVLKYRPIKISDSKYYFDFPIPTDSTWVAFWYEVTFDLGNGDLMPVTSETFIIPEDKWFADECHGEECRGSLV